MNEPQGVRGLLGRPRLYDIFQNAIGQPRQREIFVRQFVRPRIGDRILDIGCGTADILAQLEPFDIRYTGIEPNEAYVAHARRRWTGKDYEFQVGAVGADPPPSVEAHAYDIAIVFGVMHHLPDDDVRELLRLAAHGLRPGGRLVTLDSCRLPDMNVLERLAVRYDRGSNIRAVSEYEALVDAEFGSVRHAVQVMARVPLRAAVFMGEAAAISQPQGSHS